MPPAALVAVHLAEDMVEQHIGRSRRIGAGIVADHRIEAERGLHRRALEPLAEELARRFGEQLEHVALHVARQPREQPPGGQRLDQTGEAAADIGRRPQRQVAQHIGHPVEHRVIARQRLGIALREARELGLRPLEPPAQDQMVALGQRQEIGNGPLDDAIAALHQPHVRDDARLQQADGIARHRIAETGMELLGHRRAADDAPRLDDAHVHARTREIEGAGQSVMPAPDDDRIRLCVALRHGLKA